MSFIDAYNQCEDDKEVAEDVKRFVTKKYLSHRRIPLFKD
jgi:hypothetical protein